MQVCSTCCHTSLVALHLLWTPYPVHLLLSSARLWLLYADPADEDDGLLTAVWTVLNLAWYAADTYLAN